MSGFVFPAPHRPRVSIVIPVFGRREWTVRALGALLASTEPCYELIVVDNASPDGSADVLDAATENVLILRNPANLGFAVACNQGAARARGEHLVFLNSDALVHDGWLPPLVETAARLHVGAAGPRFLNLDGSVQEAGVLLYGDAMTGNYGTGADGTAPDVDRPRVVDYVSAACLLVRRRAFDEVGGFDPVYGSAYYEDVDLCLALAGRGYLTLYEPRSVVTHAHGWSGRAPADVDAILANRELFSRRWADVLAARPSLEASERPRVVAARDGPMTDRLLVVASGSPERVRRAADLAGRVAGLCPRAHVALLPADGSLDRARELGALGVEVVHGGGAGLSDRRFHYDVVLEAGPLQATLAAAVRGTQPQALRLVDLEADELGRGTAGADVLLVASKDARRNVVSEPRSTPVFTVGDEAPVEQVIELLAYLGFELSGPVAGATPDQPVTV